MNRSIDARSDLYSLGVTFYEMLTGTLPFTAADPMEWVHCHIARQPVPPDERATGIPAVLSHITMKLLAKTAEERYQTAAGVEADLRRCLAEWESRWPHRPVSAGRARRIGPVADSGAAVWARARDRNAARLFRTRRGPRHAGARARVRLFRDRQVLRGARAAQGAGSIARALCIRQIRPIQARHSLRHVGPSLPEPGALAAESGRGGTWPVAGLLERGARLEWLSSSWTSFPSSSSSSENSRRFQSCRRKRPRSRFQMAFRRFLGVFARKEHPLALFLDDLQWLDSATLDLLEHLVTHPEVRHLLLVGAYRDNEVGRSHPLMRTLEAIRETGARVHEIVLAPLGLGDVGRLVADALHCGPERAQALAELVKREDRRQSILCDSVLDRVGRRGSARVRLRRRPSGDGTLIVSAPENYTDNVVDFMATKLKRLSTRTQEAIKRLACLGSAAESRHADPRSRGTPSSRCMRSSAKPSRRVWSCTTAESTNSCTIEFSRRRIH